MHHERNTNSKYSDNNCGYNKRIGWAKSKKWRRPCILDTEARDECRERNLVEHYFRRHCEEGCKNKQIKVGDLAAFVFVLVVDKTSPLFEDSSIDE